MCVACTKTRITAEIKKKFLQQFAFVSHLWLSFGTKTTFLIVSTCTSVCALAIISTKPPVLAFDISHTTKT